MLVLNDETLYAADTAINILKKQHTVCSIPSYAKQGIADIDNLGIKVYEGEKGLTKLLQDSSTFEKLREGGLLRKLLTSSPYPSSESLKSILQLLEQAPPGTDKAAYIDRMIKKQMHGLPDYEREKIEKDWEELRSEKGVTLI